MTEIVSKCIYEGDLILGDDGYARLPDLYSEDLANGFEIVQCELDCDLNMKYVFQAIKQGNGDYEKTKEKLKEISLEYDFNADEYEFFVLEEKVVSVSHRECFRYFHYLKNILKENIKKKLRKLNNGNYSGCKKVSLVISNIERLRGKDDAELTLRVYQETSKMFKDTFDSVFLVTIGGIYEVSKEVRLVTTLGVKFGSCVKAMKNALGFDEY